MFIQTEETPNPQTLKFLPEKPVLDGASGVRSLEFKKNQDASSCPLAKRLLLVEGIEGVFLSADYLSITKREDFDWYVLKPSVLGLLMEHFVNGLPIYNGNAVAQNDDSDPVVKQIREIIDTRVRPSVAMDGGDITFESFEDGIVYLKLQGACSGCPSSSATLKSGIENMLKYYVPEVQEVRQYGE
ncbi:MAG: NifU family protein [Proteobacteria bacterium]|nr:NifU family protein [Pseudomonadota bacterium]